MAASTSLLVLAALFLLFFASCHAQFSLGSLGGLNRGGTAQQAGTLAASAFGKQQAAASNRAAEAASFDQGQKASAAAAASREAAAYGKNAYEQRIAQELYGVLSYCEGYICTEWLDEYGAAYSNSGASAYQTAEGYGKQAQSAEQFSAADRAAFAASQQEAAGQQSAAQEGALRGQEGYGAATGGSQWGSGFYQVPAGFGGLSGSQASTLGLASSAQQLGSIYGSAAAKERAQASQGERANVAEAAAAQAQAAMMNAAAAKQSAFTVEQISRLKNYGRKCRRYQCYHKYWDGSVYSYGPNYYTAQGEVVREAQDQAAHQAGYADQRAAADRAAFAAEEGVAQQYGAGAVGAGESAYGSGFGAGGWY